MIFYKFFKSIIILKNMTTFDKVKYKFKTNSWKFLGNCTKTFMNTTDKILKDKVSMTLKNKVLAIFTISYKLKHKL